MVQTDVYEYTKEERQGTIMKDTMKTRFDSNTPVQISNIELSPDKQGSFGIAGDTAEVCKRFWRAAKAAPQGAFLGLQLAAISGEAWQVSVFAGEGAAATVEDFDWIVGNCGKAKAVRKEMLDPMDAEGYTVYVLRSPENGDSEKNSGSELWPKMSASELWDIDRSRSSAYTEQALDALLHAGAIVRLIAGGAGGGPAAVLVSLRGEMSLRLRALLALAFTGTSVEKLAGPDEIGHLSGKCLLEAMMELLRTLLYACCPEERKQAASADTAPIEELSLSVRPYNCLKRAGVNTIAQLRCLSGEQLRRIRNLTEKCVVEIQRKLAERESLLEALPPAGPGGFALLEELVGLQNVKEQMRKIAALAKMKRDMAERGMGQVPVVLNMEFTGNPGTAKTTVARIAARLFHEIGLLESDELVEVGRADLVARYEGQTADQVKGVFERAKGKLLFIDEAYSLVEKDGLYGDEAINTIVLEMENRRDDTIVIFAGYPGKMDAFLAKNPGLRSRIPFQIHFADYSAGEMLQIVELEAGKRGFSLLPEAKETALSICAPAAYQTDLGNGRFCRNLVESAILNYASRVYGSDQAESERDFRLTSADFTPPASLMGRNTARRIGFLP